VGVRERLRRALRPAARPEGPAVDGDAVCEALPQPVWRRDPALRLVYCNAAYAAAVGHAAEAVVADGVELVDGYRRPEALALAESALRSGTPQRARLHAVIRGQRRLLEITETPLAAGGLLGQAQDLTAWEEAAAEVQRQQAAHDAVLESLGVGVAIFGADLSLRFFNPAYQRLWALDEAFLDRRPHLGDVLDRLHDARLLPQAADYPAFRREAIRFYRTLLRSHEELMHLPSGDTFRLFAYPHPLGGVVLTFEDVTDRLRLERTYNPLLAVQRQTLDNLQEAVAVFGSDGRLQLCNPTYRQVWNLPAGIARDRPHVRQVIELSRPLLGRSEEEWPQFAEQLAVFVTEPEIRDGRYERVDGRVLQWSQRPLPDGGTIISMLDVTDAIRLEEMLRERVELFEAADRLKSEFIANVSYELRTPLNAIVGFSELLRSGWYGPLNPRQIGFADAIQQASQRLNAFVGDLLDLASIEAGYLRLEPREVSIADLLRDVLALWHERARNESVHLQLATDETVGSVRCDPRRIGQALSALLSNACKFTPAGGLVRLAATRREGRLCLRVEDSGPGIPEANRRRLQGAFERGQIVNSRIRDAGPGLGLTLARRLIELHGGTLTIDDSPEGGASVRLELPVSPPEGSG